MNTTIDKELVRRLRERWHSILRRCEKPNYVDYNLYGAKGISVCKEWHSFDSFAKWFFYEANSPIGTSNAYDRMRLSVDRIDNDRGYCPSNCRLSTQKEQCNNMRKTRFIEFNGEVFSMRNFCSEMGINFSTFYSAFAYKRNDIRNKRIRIVSIDRKKLNKFLRKHATRHLEIVR